MEGEPKAGIAMVPMAAPPPGTEETATEPFTAMTREETKFPDTVQLMVEQGTGENDCRGRSDAGAVHSKTFRYFTLKLYK